MATTKTTTTTKTTKTTSEQKTPLGDGKYYVTISENLRKCIVETKSGVYVGTITNTKPTTHIKWTDNNGKKYDVLVPTDVTIDGERVTTKFLTQKDFENFLINNAKKSFFIDKSTKHAKKQKLDLHTVPEFAEKLKKIDELQKQIDDIMQSIKTSDTYKQLTQTEKQKQAQNNLIDKVKLLIASGAIKIDDLQ